MSYPHELIHDAEELARYQGWSEEVYRDLLAVKGGALTEAQFAEKYCWEKAVMVVDMTGFTRHTMRNGELPALLRIVEAHQVTLPVIRDGGADLIRSFADDLVALFDDPYKAVRTALEIHDRVEHYAGFADDDVARCCIGIGYGKVLRIGPNLAQGDEMNRASKLGEDIANARETLVTENVASALAGNDEFVFRALPAETIFPYYRATGRG